MAVPRWIDSHCHLQDRYRPDGGDLGGVLAEAAGAGVGGVVCVGTDEQTSRQALAMARAHGSAAVGLWATAGLHPHEASAGAAVAETFVEELAMAAPEVVVAVGECGLDYHYDHSPRADQRQVFASQVALACRLGRTLVVHSREAWDDTLDILAAEGPPERTVLHCFTGGPEEARRCLDLGAYLSFSGIVTFANAQEVREAAAMCPEDRLLVETDAPFLAPVPHRGRPNRPAWVVAVGEAVAAIRKVAPSDLARSSSAATRAAFGLTVVAGTEPA